MEEQGKEGTEDDVEEGMMAISEGDLPLEQPEMTLSVHANKDSQSMYTIRVLGRYKDRQLVILVDSGSTNTFLDERVANVLKVPLVQVPPAIVKVADERTIVT